MTDQTPERILTADDISKGKAFYAQLGQHAPIEQQPQREMTADELSRRIGFYTKRREQSLDQVRELTERIEGLHHALDNRQWLERQAGTPLPMPKTEFHEDGSWNAAPAPKEYYTPSPVPPIDPNCFTPKTPEQTWQEIERALRSQIHGQQMQEQVLRARIEELERQELERQVKDSPVHKELHQTKLEFESLQIQLEHSWKNERMIQNENRALWTTVDILSRRLGQVLECQPPQS